MKTKAKNKRKYCKRSKKFVTVAASNDFMIAQQYASILKKNGINAMVRNDNPCQGQGSIKLMVTSEDLENALRIIEPIAVDNDFFSSIYDLERDMFTGLAG